MHAVHWSPVLRRLVLATGLALFALLLGARAAAAAEPERKNCPDGFVWVRMSGTACVQEKVPANGKITYDGHANCIEPYVGIFEFRPTTNGSPPPGAPYTSFSYLLECVTTEERDRRAKQAPPGDFSKVLADPLTRLPPAEDLVVIGITATGTFVVAASRFRTGPKPPAPTPAAPASPPPTETPPAEASQASTPVTTEPLPTDPEEIRRRLAQLATVEAELERIAREIREKAAANQLTAEDYITFIGIAADLIGPFLPGPWQAVAGGASIYMNLTQVYHDARGWDIRAIYRDVRGRLDDIARLRGMIAGDTEALERALAEAEKPREPVPGRNDLDPSVMPDDMLREERDRAQQRVNEAFDADRRANEEADRLRDAQRQQADKIRDLRRVLDAADAARESTLRGVEEDGNTAVNLAAGIDGFIQKHGEDAANDLVKAARAAMMDTLGEAEYVKHVEGLWGAEALARDAKAGGKFANVAGFGTALVSGYEWIRDFGAEQQRVVVEQMIENLSHRMGELDMQVTRADQEAASTTQAFHGETARRDALRTEHWRRAEEQGQVLWPK